MKISDFQNCIPQISYFNYVVKWLLLSLIIGTCIGSASAFFLISLDWATAFREDHLWIIALLPAGGLVIGLLYYYFGESVVKGNNLLLEEYQNPKDRIPLKMAPLVLIGTLITHLFGGSAGREGTAVQMGGAIADQFTGIFKLNDNDRKIIIIMGISAGFSSVFGTPLAGTLFALEVLVLGSMLYEALLPSLLAALIADISCRSWNITHTHYHVPEIPQLGVENLLYVMAAGILFGLTALLFSKTVHFFSTSFKSAITYPPLRPLFGGIVIAAVVWMLGTTKYVGLGVPTILESFQTGLPPYAFILKLLLTTFTLGAGFKGGEVTPLFFIGAALGNALFLFIPLPVALLAGMGFTAVFAGATNTPVACTVMGIELFGIDCGIYIGLACFTAYLFSGHTGIYSSQVIGIPKHILFENSRGKRLNDL